MSCSTRTSFSSWASIWVLQAFNYIFDLHATVTADGPGSVHLTGLVGHKGRSPCHVFCGLNGRLQPGTTHYYPALLLPVNYSVSGSNFPDTDVNTIHFRLARDYEVKLLYLMGSHNTTDYKNRQQDTRTSRPSLISDLPRTAQLPLASCLCGDAMHMCSLNVGDLFLPLWRGSFDCSSMDSPLNWPWAVLKGQVWKQHGKAVANTCSYIPGSYDRPPRNIAEKINSGYKAKEWQNYLYGLAPALLHAIFPHAYWQNFCKFVYSIHMIHQRQISWTQLQEAQRVLSEWCIEYEELYIQWRADRLHFMRPCVHALLHQGLEIHRIGLPGLSSTWTMECTIGNLGQEIRQPSNPYANLSQ